jgi:hypothetical protein
MTTPKTFAGFSEEDARREAARQAGLPPPADKGTGKKGRKKKTPEVPVVPAIPTVPAVPAPAPAPAKSPTANPVVFGIESLTKAVERVYRISSVKFMDNEYMMDFATSLSTAGAQNQEFWIKNAKAALGAAGSYVGCAPLYYSIWREMYDHRHDSKFGALIETARRELSDVMNSNRIMTLSTIAWNLNTGKDFVKHDAAACALIRRNLDIKGAPGSLKGVINALPFCEAVFEKGNVQEVYSVLEWLTEKEPFLLRKDHSVGNNVTCPVIIETDSKFCYIKTAENISTKAKSLPVYVYNLRPSP